MKTLSNLKFPMPEQRILEKWTIFCKRWKRWSVSCYAGRLLSNQIAGEPTGPYQLPSNKRGKKTEVLSDKKLKFQKWTKKTEFYLFI